MNDAACQAQAAFEEALESSSPEARERFLTQCCAGDMELQQRVRRLLDAHEAAGEFLRIGAPHSPVVEAQLARLKREEAGERIGPYKLLQEIGEGGFGTVWMAEQMQPVKRRVALKIIKLGMDTKEVIARFEQEQQALAMMDHPNIARVFDAGATQRGRPFFVLELVRGMPITTYCDEQKLPVPERLALFIQVCQAVQHAHQKGIIHRDLKPSNILVTAGDDHGPVPKIIDFGVAKAMDRTLTDKTLFTQFEQMIGTPAYMSPEQTGAGPMDIDTRSDIYTLGVVLYEMLTGKPPFDPQELRQAGHDEMRRVIREVDPPKPSTRLSTMQGIDLTAVATHRHVEPAKLTPLIRGDLDWIVMKALEKNRNRRYETANGLALDLRRHLDDEIVTARPPSAGYVLAKLVRRYRTVLATAGAVLLALVAGFSVSLWQAVRATRAEGQAKLNEQSARLAEAKALFDHAAVLHTTRKPGYRREVWTCLHEAAQLDPRKRDATEFRDLIVSCLGDPVGLDPVSAPVVERSPPIQASEVFRAIIAERQRENSTLIAALTPDGEFLAIYQAGQLELWETGNRNVARVTSPLGGVHDLNFSSDGKLLIGGCEEGVAVWTVPSLHVRTFFGGGAVSRVAAHPDGIRVAALNDTDIGQIEIWSLASNRQLGIVRAPNSVSRVEFSADGNMLLGATSNGVLVSGWQLNATPEKRYLVGHDGGIPAIAFSPDGRTLASVSKDRTLRLWEVETGRLKHICRGPESDIQDVAFSPDGRVLISGDWNGDLWTWDQNSGEGIVAARHPGQIWRLRFDSSGEHLFSAGSGGIVVWGVVSTERRPLTPMRMIPFDSVVDLAVHPAGTRLALARYGSGLVYDCDLLKEAIPQIQEFKVLPPSIRTLNFADAGKRLIFIAPDKKIGGFDFSKRAAVTASTLTVAGTSTAISPDERLIAYAHTPRSVSLFDLANNRELLALGPELNNMWCWGWNNDGTHLAIGLSDGGLVIWNLSEVRQRLAEFGIDVPSVGAGQGWTAKGAVPSPDLTLSPRRDEIPSLTDASTPAELLRAMALKAKALSAAAHHDEAIKVQNEVLTQIRRVHGPESLETIEAVTSLARFYDVAGRSDDALKLREERLKLRRKVNGPEHPDTLAAISSLADSYSGLGHWDEALPLLAESSERTPKNALLAVRIAALQAWFGKDADHAATCQRMLKLAVEADDDTTAERAAKACCLRASSDPQLIESALALARRAVDRGKDDKYFAWFQMALGMAEYRLGHYAAADTALGEALKSAKKHYSLSELAQLYQAMSFVQQGRKPEARKLFAEAGTRIKPLPANERQPLANGAYTDDLIAWLAYKEAKALLESNADTVPAKP